MNKQVTFPIPSNNILSVKDVLKRDGYIKYRCNYSKGKTDYAISSFNKPCITIRKSNVLEVYPEGFTIE